MSANLRNSGVGSSLDRVAMAEHDSVELKPGQLLDRLSGRGWTRTQARHPYCPAVVRDTLPPDDPV